MASPLSTGKQSVNLTASKATGSRIRRDPPPPVKTTVVPDRDETDRNAVAIGIVVFTLAIAVIILGLASANGWSPREVVARL